METALVSNGLFYAGLAALVIAAVTAIAARNLWAKATLILGVILVCASAMYPPTEKLNLGLDLRGGTSLLYEVDTSGVEDPRETVLQTIAVLRERVDPRGVRNLNWQIESGNRIQVQMPLPGERVVQRRQALQDLLERVEATSIERAQIQRALRLEGPARQEALAQLAGEVEGRMQPLQAAAEAYDQLQAARQQLENLEPGTPAFIEQSGQVARSEIALDEALDAVDATDLNRAELMRVLALSTQPEFIDEGEPIEGSSPRAEALAQLKESHPARSALIDQIVTTYDAYQQVKGPLDDPNDLIRLLQGAGVLEFRIALTPGQAGDVQQLRRQLEERGPQSFPADAPRRWYVIDDPAQFAQNAEDLEAMRENPVAFFQQRGLIGAEYGGDFYLLLWNQPGRSMTAEREGWELEQATQTPDQLGLPAVSFTLNEIGANLMAEMTEDNVGLPMAVVLDDRVYSAPNINEQLRNNIQISGGQGGFSEAEINYLLRTLNAGSLQARLSPEPISIRQIGPSIGQQNLEHGLGSAIYALIAVAVFMMIYYFFAGAVADLALAANLIIILGVLSMVQAAFTLPGIAGIVLTIGMCVDANVLIFERIREELRRGADMPTSLRLGYQRAFSSIIDGNLTNLIICFILYYTATADVKGFAVTLGIGIVATLFTSLFMTRVIFTIYDRYFPVKRLSMLPLIVPAVERALHPKLDWISKRAIFFTISGAAVIASIALVSVRGVGMLDIEFRAGTEVTVDLREGERITLEEARQRLRDAELQTFNVVTIGELRNGEAGQFSIQSTETQSAAVADEVQEAFAGLLDIQPSVRFAAADVGSLAQAPVYPITQNDLGEVIGRPEVENEVPEFLGGVAIVIEGMNPPQTLESIEQRIETMRFQPDFADVQHHRFRLIGLEPAQGQPNRFRSAVVVSSHPTVNYFDSPEAWESVLAANEWRLVREALGRETTLSKVSSYDNAVAASMTNQAIVALLLSFVAIVAYIWFRFGSLRFGLAAIAAIVHDVVITLGLVALSYYIYQGIGENPLLIEPFKINMGLIAALLTIIGYSLNDTIVLFDRIRENRGKLATAGPGIINDSINQVISRTALTSTTTFLAVAFMYFIGGPGIHAFAFALVVGVIVGTYSSIAIASPLLLVGTGPRKPDAAKRREPAQALGSGGS